MNPALRGSVAVLLIRLIVGVAFLFHGWPKIQNPMHWLDLMPGHPPGFLQAMAAVAEFGGGIALILGLLTPLACAGIIATMGFALFVHVSHGDPFVAMQPGQASFELALLFLVLAVSLLLTGPGRYSLDQKLLGRRIPNDY